MPVRGTCGLAQETVFPAVEISGAAMSCGTSMVSVSVQPLAAVTSTVYIPGVETAGLGSVELKLFGPFHKYVTGTDTVELMGTIVTEQVRTSVARVVTGLV